MRDQILATFKRYTTESVAQKKLDATRSRLRYGFALAMDSSEGIAGALAEFVGLRRTPETLNKLFALYDQVTPADISAAASHYFIDTNRSIVTLTASNSGNNNGGAK